MKERQMNGVKQRRQFDETSKRHAVELSLRGERIVKAVAEELGISPDRLYLWRGLYAPKPSGIAQAKPDRTIEQVEECQPAVASRGAATARTGDRVKKNIGHPLRNARERYVQVKAMKGEHHIGLRGELLGVSRSGYYRWESAGPSTRQREDATLKVEIARFHRKSRGNYGAPRIVADLREAGCRTSRRRLHSPDEATRCAGQKEASTQTAHHRQSAWPHRGPQSAKVGRRAERTQSGLGDRHHLLGDRRRLAVSGGDPRRVEPPGRRLGLCPNPRGPIGDRGLSNGFGTALLPGRHHSSFRSRQLVYR
jgi:transposase-like protein